MNIWECKMGHLRRLARGFVELSLVAAVISFAVGCFLILLAPLIMADLYGWEWLGLYAPLIVVASYFLGDDN